ncbi:uncharacterized protein LOC108250206 [Kryptolebias marmoratus]|uniref:uncharacterized protein LOC108250206 n=1 Tax=Kryptolebias marmoratus TaxID=37003 RepID=UPI0007F868F5|nr:uncharacterized protein LOC108250206 [Kryptolebias marmoratus]XP_017295462.1 uncharacterized protein LOC108250206 [Kryptolebias marmoratus]
MLRPLLYLSALIVVPGAVGQTTFNESSKFNISSCPITFYGQKYEDVYINFTSQNSVVCFNGFYDPQAGGDCLLGPQASLGVFYIFSSDQLGEQRLLQEEPTINATLGCYMSFYLDNDTIFYIENFGSQAALTIEFFSPGTHLTDVIVNGITVHTLNITNTESNGQYYDYLDLSACRHRGVLYETNTTTYDPEFCETVQCSDTAVLDVTTCGPMEMCHNGTCVNGTVPEIQPASHIVFLNIKISTTISVENNQDNIEKLIKDKLINLGLPTQISVRLLSNGSVKVSTAAPGG